MNRLRKAAVTFCCVFGLGITSAQAQFTNVTASSIKMGSVAIASGIVTFTPVNQNGQPIPFVAGGGGGLYDPSAIPCTITAGAITGSCQVADSALTTPANIFYQITVSNTSTGKAFTMQAVANITGTTWPLDHYAPASVTSNIQSVQSAYGTGAPPNTCVAPSFYTRNASGGQLYTCVASTFIQVAGGTFVAPTGNGFFHVTSGSQDIAARAVNLSTAGDVTGNLPVANGGTGTSTPGLLAGTNVTLTGTWPNQTVNSTASGGASISLTTTGSGAATLSGSVLNVPTPSGGGTAYTGTAPIVVSGSVISATVGTAANTLAAGNDSRITGALSAATAASTYATPAQVATAQAAAQSASVPIAQKAANSGVASLDSSGQVPLNQLGNVPAGGGAVTSVAGRTGAVVLTSDDISPANPNINGGIAANRSSTGSDVLPASPSTGGVNYTVLAALPVVEYPDGTTKNIPQTAADILNLIKTLTGCGTGVNFLQPASSTCVTPAGAGITNIAISLPTTAIAANTCTTTATVTMTGLATTSAFSTAFATNPNAVTGWGASGGLTFTTFPTANTLNWSVCNQTAASITPGAMTLNVGAR
jgi:hypothetical protein